MRNNQKEIISRSKFVTPKNVVDICSENEKKTLHKTMNPQEEVHAIKKASKPKTNRKLRDHKGAGKPPEPPMLKIGYVTSVVNNIPGINGCVLQEAKMLRLWQKKTLQSRVSST